MRTFLALSLLLASCNTAAVNAPIQLAISTDGGFTGRGNGSVSIRDLTVHASTLGNSSCSGELTTAERSELAAAVADAKPEFWKHDYTPASNPHGNADQIRYTLELNGRSVTWIDESRASLPADLARINDLAWRVRDRVCTPNA